MAEGGQPVGQGNISPYSSMHKRGYAAFVVNVDPKGNNVEFSPRHSAREDSSNLQTVFIDKLGLEWINHGAKHQNLTVGQWYHEKSGGKYKPLEPTKCCLCCHIQSLNHSDSDCFILAISSHGREVTETEILFSDGQSITLTEVFQALSDEKCPSLKGIPRVIILQACRGNFKDQERVDAMQDCGVHVKVAESQPSQTGVVGVACGTDITDNPIPPVSRARVETSQDFTLQHVALNKMPENFLLIYPAVSGQLTQRNEIDGSWLIHALKEILSETVTERSDVQPINFLHLLTQAAGKVATRETFVFKRKRKNGESTVAKDKDGKEIKDEKKCGLKNAVCFHHRLIRPLVFDKQEKMKPDIPKPKMFYK